MCIYIYIYVRGYMVSKVDNRVDNGVYKKMETTGVVGIIQGLHRDYRVYVGGCIGDNQKKDATTL